MTFREVQQALMDGGIRDDVFLDRRFMLWDIAYCPVSADWVFANWQAWVRSLPKELQESKTLFGRSVLCPRYLPEAFDCENHALACMVHGTIGNALTMVRHGGLPRGLAKGILTYTAEGRPENRGRRGRHAICWFVNRLRHAKFFEPGDGLHVTLTPTELASIDFGCAA